MRHPNAERHAEPRRLEYPEIEATKPLMEHVAVVLVEAEAVRPVIVDLAVGRRWIAVLLARLVIIVAVAAAMPSGRREV